MKTSKVIIATIICIACQAPFSSVFAAGPWYAGIGGGPSKTNAEAADIHPNLASDHAPSSTSVDDKDTGWKVFLGYQLNRNLAGEFSYTQLGKYTLDANITLPGVGTLRDTVEPEAYCLSAVGSSNQVNSFSFFGRLGICRWDDNFKGEHTISGTVTPEASSSSGSAPVGGLGISYKINPNFSARAEWERYFNVIHDNKDADLFSVNILYRF